MTSRIVAAPISDWEEARAAYLAAKAADITFGDGPLVAAAEAEQLRSDATYDRRIGDVANILETILAEAEDALMTIPAPDGEGFALKYLIAKGGGRETDCWDQILEEEAKRFASTAPVSPAIAGGWGIALTDYEVKRKVWDRLAEIDSDDWPAACAACLIAQDHLVENVLAPTVEAATLKMELAKERWDGFSIPDEWLDAFAADVRHLCTPSAAPHLGWLAERVRLLGEYDASYATLPDGDPLIRAAISDNSRRIMETPAATRDGLLGKALFVAQLHLSPDDDGEANMVLAEAAALNVIETRS